MVIMIVRAATNLALSALKSPPTGYLSQLRNFDLVHGATIAVAEQKRTAAALQGYGPD